QIQPSVPGHGRRNRRSEHQPEWVCEGGLAPYQSELIAKIAGCGQCSIRGLYTDPTRVDPGADLQSRSDAFRQGRPEFELEESRVDQGSKRRDVDAIEVQGNQNVGMERVPDRPAGGPA